MKRRILQPMAIIFAALLFTTVFLVGCRKASNPEDKPAVSSSPKPQTPFERDLEFVREGQFTYVFVFFPQRR